MATTEETFSLILLYPSMSYWYDQLYIFKEHDGAGNM